MNPAHTRRSPRKTKFLAATLLAALASINANAAIYTFTGTDGNWATGSNWSGGTAAPVTGAHRLNINGNLIYTATTSGTGSSLFNPSDRGFIVGTTTSANASFTINGGSFSTDGSTNSQDVLGSGSASIVSLNINGGSYSTVEGLIVNFGNGATQASFNINSGSATVSKLDINPANVSGATGTVNVNGGSLTVTTLNATPTGIGSATVNVTGGTMAVTTLNTGLTTKSGGLSSINIGGGTSTVDTLNLGAYSSGTLNGTTTLTVTNGSLSVGTLAVTATGTGAASNNTSTINLDGGTLAVSSLAAAPATKGFATLNFNGGTLRTNAGITVSGFSNAFVKAGGAVIDTNGFNSTIAQALLTDAVSTGGGLTKQGAGTLTLSGGNTYTGATIVEGGTLALGSADRIANSSNLVMSGGTFATGGFSETLGALDLTAASIIDLGDGASALVFADSSGETWTGSISLSFINFTDDVDSIRIGTSGSGLTGLQLAQITINGFAAAIDSDGFLTISNIPEPSTYAALAGAGAFALVSAKRRRRAGS